MRDRENGATSDALVETRTKLFLLLTVCVSAAIAQYNPYSGPQPHAPNPYGPPPAYGYQDQSYKNQYPPALKIRDLKQSDVKNCTDINCGMEQCCVETPRAAVCVDLTITNLTTGERMCVRPKLCNQDTQCFTNGCCVYNTYVTADTTCPDDYDYDTYSDSYHTSSSYYPPQKKVPPHSFPGQVVKPRLGVCMPRLNMLNATCFLSITMNPLCPCGAADDMALVCVPLYSGSSVGSCQVQG